MHSSNCRRRTRVVDARDDGPTGGGHLKQQSYTFDPYNNLTRITTNGILRNTSTSATTNRLTLR